MIEVKKVWGFEKIYHNDKYCLKTLHLKKGYCCSLHKHLKKSEGFYVLEGKMLVEMVLIDMRLERESFVMLPGDFLNVPVGTLHCFTGLKDTVFLEASTHDDADDNVRRTISKKVRKKDFQRMLSCFG